MVYELPEQSRPEGALDFAVNPFGDVLLLGPLFGPMAFKCKAC